MPLSDPFGITYQGAYRSMGSIGEAIEKGAEVFALRKQKEREMQSELEKQLQLEEAKAKYKSMYPDPIMALLMKDIAGGAKALPQSAEEAKRTYVEQNPDIKVEELNVEPVYGEKGGAKYIAGYKADVLPEVLTAKKKTAQLKTEAGATVNEVVGMIDTVWNAANKLIPAPEGASEAELKGWERKAKTFGIMGIRPQRAFGISDEDALAYEQVIQGEATPLIRSLGEKGMLTNQDIQRALNLAPHFSDTQRLRETKKDEMTKFLTSKVKAYYEKSGMTKEADVSEDLINQYMKKYPNRSREEIIKALQKSK